MPKHKFPSDDSKERQLFEPILQKIAEKDATFAKTRLASRRRDSSRPNSSKKSAEKSKRKTDRRDSDFHSLSESVTADFPIVVKSSFPHLNFRTNSIQIEIGSEKNLSFKVSIKFIW
ncbi:hypothetical protein HHI36_019154 [Cryptolaemus montrouzieri]|uniref:Uncharacterized protein n=1 Tax=Cryptolaemus montrouzieri TaxID=559131 RepID=A0ABD2P2V2_9CUCU